MASTKKRAQPPAGMKWIFRPWVTDPNTGKRVYPRKSRVFRLLVPINRVAK